MASLFQSTMGQGLEMLRIFQSKGMTAADAAAILKNPDLVKAMLDSLRAARIEAAMLERVVQASLLARYNGLYWENRFTQDQLAAAVDQIRTATPHTQRLDDLVWLHVQFGSLAETVEMWTRVYKGELPRFDMPEDLRVDDEHLQLHELATTYQEGIHLVRGNVLANQGFEYPRGNSWDVRSKNPRGYGYEMQYVRRDAAAAGDTLAQLEVLSLWGLMPDLLQLQYNGFPRPTDLGGTRFASVRGRDGYLSVHWYAPSNTFSLGAGLESGPRATSSVPVMFK